MYVSGRASCRTKVSFSMVNHTPHIFHRSVQIWKSLHFLLKYGIEKKTTELNQNMTNIFLSYWCKENTVSDDIEVNRSIYFGIIIKEHMCGN